MTDSNVQNSEGKSGSRVLFLGVSMVIILLVSEITPDPSAISTDFYSTLAQVLPVFALAALVELHWIVGRDKRVTDELDELKAEVEAELRSLEKDDRTVEVGLELETSLRRIERLQAASPTSQNFFNDAILMVYAVTVVSEAACLYAIASNRSSGLAFALSAYALLPMILVLLGASKLRQVDPYPA